MRINNFQELVNRYESIKPIDRGFRKNRNVRPIDERRYWWNRIYKHSENYYAFSCGTAGWDTNATPYWDNTTDENRAKILHCMLVKSPIVWERRKDGDYIRINRGEGCATSTYKFLRKHLPKGLEYSYPYGKHCITCNGEKHAMPSGRYSDTEHPTLEFKYIEDGKWERVNDKFLLKTQRVDKERAKMLKPHIKNLWEWMNIVLPVFGRGLRTHMDDAFNNIRKHTEEPYYQTLAGTEAYDFMLDVITNEGHESRMDFALALVSSIDAYDVRFINTDSERTWIGFTEHWFAPKEKSYARLRKLIYKITDSYLYDYQ